MNLTTNAYKILDENPERRDHLENIVIDGRITLMCMLHK